MKRILSFQMLLLILGAANAQDRDQSTNSFFDDSEIRAFAVKNILIQGEVQDPGPVDLSPLPLRNIAIKELAMENGDRVFKGAYFVGGYSLYDILNSKKVKKSPENAFAPPVDLYVIVENDQGEKAAFSWGEIYYRNSFDILVTKSIQAINPARSKKAWQLPETPRLVCGNDFFNVRYIDNPSKITVKSFHGAVPKDKPKDIFSPDIKIVSKTGSFTVTTIAASIEKRTYTDVSYGHGMGYKGTQSLSGYPLRELIAANLKIGPEALGRWIAVASAKDGYRSVLSLSEIMNRSDDQDLLLIEKKEPGNGRYVLYPAGDFFADRDVRAVEKIEIIDAE